ncbi:short neuropeptide F-like [Daphnia pulicaria]|uniref:short neuropeptide F-like n=1 Tax=Daphnia pulicaria TaxID=35523 RepID=UPI001EEBC1CF|nr:short neuropeptide F-like [Daphnia pulicaria]
MELCPRINCWTTRTVLLVTFVVFLIHQDNQQNIASASPTPLLSGFEDYSEDRLNGEQPSLYELLLQREMLADKLESEGRGHLIVRKSDRSPSLRLRFGRRADPDVPRVSAASQHD